MLKITISFIFGILFCLLILFNYNTYKNIQELEIDITKLEYKLNQNKAYTKEVEDLLTLQSKLILKLYHIQRLNNNSIPFYKNDIQIIDHL